MNMLIMENFRNVEVPEIDVNVYNTSNKKIVYTAVMQFNGEQFVCHRVYDEKMIESTLGHSFTVNFAELAKQVEKPEIISLMKNAIACCILQSVTVIKDLEKIFVDDINIFPNFFAVKKRDIDKFIEDCYFMIS
jgi:hypothetical protein